MDKLNDSMIFDNAASVVNNQSAKIDAKECERALGSKNNVIRASNLGLQNSDLFRLIIAHLLLKYCLENAKSAEQIKEYKSGLTDMVDFLAKCVQELEQAKIDSQQKETQS